MTSPVPFSWLRRLVAALRRWAGTVSTGLARWEHHQGRLAGGATFSVCLPPLPPVPPGERSDLDRHLRTELERLRAVLVTGVKLAPPLLPATKLGAVIHARLEVELPDRWPALLVVHPDEPPCTGPDAPGRV